MFEVGGRHGGRRLIVLVLQDIKAYFEPGDDKYCKKLSSKSYKKLSSKSYRQKINNVDAKVDL